MKYLLVLVLSFSSCFLAGCYAQYDDFDTMVEELLSHSVPETTVDRVEGFKSVVWLDAREKKEFDVSHIPGAKWIGYDDFEINRLEGIGKSDTIIVYCSVGYRSEKISEKLVEGGYNHVWNLTGGIFDWVNTAREVVNADGNTTDIHPYNDQWGKWLTRGEKTYE